ncbi:MAG: DUF4118 domain-containing protein [Anaerolineaceae bacterium]
MKKFLLTQLLPQFYRHLAALAIIVLTAFLLDRLEPHLEIQIIALIFLLPVMGSTVLWGLTPGILAGILAFLAFNYYFIPPYYTLLVHQNQDLITLIIFLVVAVVMSQLIGQAREGTRLARIREWEATRMYKLISALASLQDTASIAQTLANHTLKTFDFEHVDVVLNDETGKLQQTASAPNAETPPFPPLLSLPLKTARRQEGEIRLWREQSHLTEEETRLLEAFTSQGALSIERIRLTKSEYKAQVLEESDRLKSSLLSSVSHELRSPLAAIKASVSSLRSGTVDWDTPARGELLEMIEDETDKLNQLVGNLLDMSRIESGALNLQRNWNAIGEIALGAASKMRKQLQDHQLEADFPDDLPLVPTDYVMIEQVFINLLSNSIKYAPRGTIIRMRAYSQGDFLHVVVMNQSPKVPVEDLERIFDKFHRITAADRVMGTGLGLSICKGIIEAHGGKIWAENQPEFFVFHFTLPLTLNGVRPEIPKETEDE